MTTEIPARSADRWGTLAGFAFVAFAVAAIVLCGDAPSGWSSDASIRAYYADGANRVRDLAAILLMPVAGCAFLVYAGAQWSRLRRADPDGTAPVLAFAGGVLFATLFGAAIVTQAIVGASLELSDRYRVDVDVARTLGELPFWLAAFGAGGAAVSVAAAASVAGRTGVLSRRLRWPGRVLAVLLAVGMVPLWGAPVALYGVWILATSWLMLRGRQATARAGEAALAAG